MTGRPLAPDRRLKTVRELPDVVPVLRVRKAYEQVADHLRELILSGRLSPGDRLPNEAVLAHDFGVSRATVREALRVLATQNLIRTTKGAAGGSYVTLPTVDHISAFVHANVNLLTESQRVTLEELLEARELVEIPATRLAAERRTELDVEKLRATVPPDQPRLGTREEFAYNSEFHSCVIEASGNALLAIAAQPIFSVLQTNLARSTLGRQFHRAVHEHHRRIIEAVEAADADAAAGEMRDHLEFLTPYYEKAWRHAVRTQARALPG